MIRFLALLCLLVVSVAAFPASNEQLDKKIGGSYFNADKELFRQYKKLGYYLDKATINDVAINTVSEEKKVEQKAQVQSVAAQPSSSSIQISGLSTGAGLPQSVAPVENTPFKPPRAGSMFARLIDDIFQIPITVLQNVARLITNPFQRKPEVVATVS